MIEEFLKEKKHLPKKAKPHAPRTRVVSGPGRLKVYADGTTEEEHKRWDGARIAVSQRRLRAEALTGKGKRWYVWKLWDNGNAECTSGLLTYPEAFRIAGERRDDQSDESVELYSYWPGTDIESARAQRGGIR